MLLFWVPHPPFAEGLGNQSHCVFFYGYTSFLCIQKLPDGLLINLDMYGDKFLLFSVQNGMTRYKHCHMDSTSSWKNAEFSCLPDIFQMPGPYTGFTGLCAGSFPLYPWHWGTHSLLPALPVPPSLTRHRHIQWFCGCTDHNRHQIHPLILSISSYALFTKSLSCLLQWLIILFSFEYWRQTGIGWAYPSIIPISDKVLHIRVLSSSIVISFVSDLPYKSSSFILAHIASQRALSWHLPPSLFILCTIPQRFSSAL